MDIAGAISDSRVFTIKSGAFQNMYYSTQVIEFGHFSPWKNSLAKHTQIYQPQDPPARTTGKEVTHDPVMTLNAAH